MKPDLDEWLLFWEDELLLLLLELLELVLLHLDFLRMGLLTSTILLLSSKEEEDKLLGLDAEERELLELEELEELEFFSPGIRIFWSFISTALSSRTSSSSLTLIVLRIFSAALSPT